MHNSLRHVSAVNSVALSCAPCCLEIRASSALIPNEEDHIRTWSLGLSIRLKDGEFSFVLQEHQNSPGKAPFLLGLITVISGRYVPCSQVMPAVRIFVVVKNTVEHLSTSIRQIVPLLSQVSSFTYTSNFHYFLNRIGI